MSRKVVKVGIMPRDAFRKRTIEIAKGEYKPKRGEPKVWFESIQSMAQVLSNSNQDLLATILRHEPDSMKELARITGRTLGNLSRTLHTMQRYGIVELKKQKTTLKPIVKARDFRIEFGLGAEPNHSRKAAPGKAVSRRSSKAAIA